MNNLTFQRALQSRHKIGLQSKAVKISKNHGIVYCVYQTKHKPPDLFRNIDCSIVVADKLGYRHGSAIKNLECY